jgi:hypothetical protein
MKGGKDMKGGREGGREGEREGGREEGREEGAYIDRVHRYLAADAYSIHHHLFKTEQGGRKVWREEGG